ncbi:response regulator receiver protein [Gloeomargarita lithophora Alchichica-D10]|uniref:Response regulator receiver protein n=2 Tax=Gloeomargarita TaxID=1188227 RepID=A0A1J0AE42_9CYAN|nr:response regulator receiver protein [Gloeomargarita lithophora Alchichica-D10]
MIGQEPLLKGLMWAKQQQETGCFVFTLGEHRWWFYLFMGRVVYATGGVHPVRRWRRLSAQHWPGYSPKPQRVTAGLPWEYGLVAQGLAQGDISKEEAQTWVRAWSDATLWECLMTWERKSSLTPQIKWQAGQELPQRWMLLQVDYWWQAGQTQVRRWQSLIPVGLERVPVIDRPGQLKNLVSAAAYQHLTQVLDGRSTLWEIAQRVGRPVEQVVGSLRTFIDEGIVLLREVGDLAAPVVQAVPPQRPQSRPVIACIDDSPVVAQALGHILEPAGYAMLSITDPLRSLSVLLQSKPALIFLDLVMPETNGYEICTFLRKSAAFQTTPIVILTGQGGVIDRVRAKLCGANDFMAKPPVAERVLEVVQTLIPAATPAIVAPLAVAC